MQFRAAHLFQLDRRVLVPLVLAGLLVLLAGLLGLFVQGAPMPWDSLGDGPLTSPIRWDFGWEDVA